VFIDRQDSPVVTALNSKTKVWGFKELAVEQNMAKKNNFFLNNEELINGGR